MSYTTSHRLYYATRSRTKGQVVIAKEIRDLLGITPGWMALQRVVDDHVEIRFFPPDHRESLKGTLAPYVTRHINSEDFAEAKEQAWQRAAERRMRGISHHT